MKIKKIAALAIIAAMMLSSILSVCVYADDSLAETDPAVTINAEVDTIYKAADLCPSGASYLKSITSWSEFNQTNYDKFGVDFGTINTTEYPSYAVNGLNAELVVNIPEDGTYSINMLTASNYWWQYSAVYVDGIRVFNGNNTDTANAADLTNTIAEFDTNNATIAKVTLSDLSAGTHKIRLTSGGAYNGLTGLVAVKLTFLKKSNYSTDDIIKAEDITRGSGRAVYINTIDTEQFVITDKYTGEVVDVFGTDSSVIGNKYLNYTDDTSIFNLKVTQAGRYKIYILGASTRSTVLTFTDKNNVVPTVTAVDSAITYGNNALFTGTKISATSTNNISVYVKACEVDLRDATYTVSLSAVEGQTYFTDFVALGMKFESAAPVLDVYANSSITDISVITPADNTELTQVDESGADISEKTTWSAVTGGKTVNTLYIKVTNPVSGAVPTVKIGETMCEPKKAVMNTSGDTNFYIYQFVGADSISGAVVSYGIAEEKTVE